MRWLTYGEFRRHHANPERRVKLLPMLKLGPLVLVLIRR